jgi:hypothetical protein
MDQALQSLRVVLFGSAERGTRDNDLVAKVRSNTGDLHTNHLIGRFENKSLASCAMRFVSNSPRGEFDDTES